MKNSTFRLLVGGSRLVGAYALLASELSGLAVDFVDQSMQVKDVATPANNFSGAPFSKLTFARVTIATYTNSSGVLVQAASGEPRFNFDPFTKQPKGYLVEEGRTNLLLNSDLAGTNLATQSPTVAAVAHTLTFYGTGSITLSGAFAGVLNGTGAYPNRATLTFTPSAGALTCTVAGNVQFAQLEAGAFATSFIPTAGATVPRAADNASILTTAFNHNASAWTLFVKASGGVPSPASDPGPKVPLSFSDGTGSEISYLSRAASTANVSASMFDGGVTQLSLLSYATVFDVPFKLAVGIALNDTASAFNGGSLSTDAAATLPTVDRLHIGTFFGNAPWGGHIQQVMHLPRRLTNSELLALTV